MESYAAEKKYEAFKIPARLPGAAGGAVQAPPQNKSAAPLSDGLFYEIDYDSSPIAGVGKFVLKPQKLEPPKRDGIRELFYEMRDIARRYNNAPFWNNSVYYDKVIRQDNARVFYKQAVFMKDFTDDYPEQAEFFSYYPYYQMLGYEQLRTYFTWRTKVREGIIAKTSLSYAFIYCYELLNNVGVESPREGLDRLIAFWRDFRAYEPSLGQYVLRWLKDYHIYYNLPQSFRDFAEEHRLTEHYPKMAGPGESFALFCSISKYDIRKSAFYTEATAALIKDCFGFVIEKLSQALEGAGMSFDDAVFMPAKRLTPWTPFKDALFFPRLKQPDRRTVLSENEIYICANNRWSFSTVISSESAKQLIGYAMKQTEAVLRRLTKYKYKLSANVGTVSHPAAQRLRALGQPLEKLITGAVTEFYREATKTVVTVDSSSLSRIRREALVTQEALSVEDNAQCTVHNAQLPEQRASVDIPDAGPVQATSGWENLREALSETELGALAVILRGGDIKTFAGECGIMLEVLAEGINEKAMDFIGDNILDGEFIVYEDYAEQVNQLQL